MFLQEIKDAFAPHNFLVTATVSMNETIASQSYDVCELTTNLDLVHVMGYDLRYPYDKKAHVHSPFDDIVSSVGQNNANVSIVLMFICTCF